MRKLLGAYAVVVMLGWGWGCGTTVEDHSTTTGTSMAVACDPGSFDDVIQGMVGEPCDQPNQECASNNGCGGCSVTCRNGAWESTDASLCYSVGPTC
jgi:hypothetical protein